jgi:hypothetical protein
MFKFFTYTDETKYIDELDNFVAAYNNSVHSKTKLKPSEINVYNQFDAWMNTYGDLHTLKDSKPFKVNDFVRIKVSKPTFSKGYTRTYTDDIYKILEVVNSQPVTYKLVQSSGDPVLVIFYPSELSKVRLEDQIS